jgi:hypothetical protein
VQTPWCGTKKKQISKSLNLRSCAYVFRKLLVQTCWGLCIKPLTSLPPKIFILTRYLANLTKGTTFVCTYGHTNGSFPSLQWIFIAASDSVAFSPPTHPATPHPQPQWSDERRARESEGERERGRETPTLMAFQLSVRSHTNIPY